MSIQKTQTVAILAVVATVVVASTLASALLMASQRIGNNGLVDVKAVGVGVYWNSGCTDNVTSIDWGSLEPGEAVDRTVYIKNNGNVRVALSMATENWNPSSASDHITLTWNREAYELPADGVIQAVLTLTISSDIENTTGFSFDIIITGTETT
jgi:hypothetical protein